MLISRLGFRHPLKGWLVLGGIAALLVVAGIVDSQRGKRMPGWWLRSDRSAASPEIPPSFQPRIGGGGQG